MLSDKRNRQSKNICRDNIMLSDKIPEDLMEGIIVKLPVKSLLRFKCVSKSWYALITDPLFITQQLEWSTSVTKNRRLKLFFDQFRLEFPFYISLGSIREKPYVVLNFELPFPKKDLKWILPRGECNGIYCLLRKYQGFYQDIILFNLATKEVKVIPPSKIKPKQEDDPRIGFGFNPITKNYKIVCFPNSCHSAEKRQLVQVYNLNTDSWTSINFEVLPGGGGGGSWSSCLNNSVCHWVVHDDDDEEAHILTFDFIKEVFTTIQLPPRVKHTRCHFKIVDEKTPVCLITNLCREKYEIWVMNNENVWTKTFETGSLLPVEEISSFWADCNFLLEETDGRLQKQMNSTPIYVRMPMMLDYIQSLVPLTTQKGKHKKLKLHQI